MRETDDPLLDLIGDARFVLLGEASQGTHEFYAERARITRRLIEERGFTAGPRRAQMAPCMTISPLTPGDIPCIDRPIPEHLGIRPRWTPDPHRRNRRGD